MTCMVYFYLIIFVLNFWVSKFVFLPSVPTKHKIYSYLLCYFDIWVSLGKVDYIEIEYSTFFRLSKIGLGYVKINIKLEFTVGLLGTSVRIT